MTPSLFVAARDIGGANALAPVVRRWRDEAGDTAATGVWQPPAAGVFARDGVAGETLADVMQPTALRACAGAALDRAQPAVVLVGTSWGPGIDKAVTIEAAQRGIPTLAVVDMWSNYRERFADLDSLEVLRYLPDRVAVMDETAAAAAIAAGLPADRVIITGQPHFDDLRRRARSQTVIAEAARARSAWSAGGRPVVLFASERIEADHGPGTPWYRGYVERDAWSGLRRAVASIDRPIALVIRRHPQEAAAAVEDDAVPCGDASALAAMVAADVVVGMTSMMLLEAALIGVPAISFEPDATSAPFVGVACGAIARARTDAELVRLLCDALDGRAAGLPAPPADWTMGRAAARVVEELRALIARRVEQVR